MMTKMCVIGVYFGAFPAWMSLWVYSASHNPTVDFLIVSDHEPECELPKNVRLVLMKNINEFKQLTEQKLEMKVCMGTPYKICDYKCVYGLILEDYIREYDYWAECDFDLIFGDIRSFTDKYQIEKYDKFLNRGHLTFYRNDRSVIDRYKLSGGKFGSYKEIFRSEMVWGLDEMYGINSIYQKHGFSCFNDFVFADIDRRYDEMLFGPEYEKYGITNHNKQCFVWKNGKVFQCWDECGALIEKEFMYIHFAKRKYRSPDFKLHGIEEFYITKNGFVERIDNSSFDNRIDNKESIIKRKIVRKDNTSKIEVLLQS